MCQAAKSRAYPPPVQDSKAALYATLAHYRARIVLAVNINDCMPSERLESQCSNCASNEATSYCDACKESKPSQDFDRNILHHAKYNSRRRVCLACAADGYSPRDTQAYPCAECGLRGHFKFSSQKLKDYKSPERRATLSAPARF